MTKRPPKKTAMLEVRVTPEEKAGFLAACKRLGRSASEVVRDAMRAVTLQAERERRTRRLIMFASPLAVLAAALFLIHPPAVEADAVHSMVDMSVSEISADGTELKRRRLSTEILLQEGVAAIFTFDDVGPARFAGFFPGVEPAAGQAVRVAVTAHRSEEPAGVQYHVSMSMRDADGEALGEPIEPRLVVAPGQPAEITIGYDGPGEADEMITLLLTPKN